MLPLAKPSHILAPGEVVAATAARAECAIKASIEKEKKAPLAAHI